MKPIKIACVADANSIKAQAACKELKKRYDVVEITKRRMNAEAIIVLGGDGFMLQTLHNYMKIKLPFYGINCGTVGFLMNEYSLELMQQSKSFISLSGIDTGGNNQSGGSTGREHSSAYSSAYSFRKYF